MRKREREVMIGRSKKRSKTKTTKKWERRGQKDTLWKLLVKRRSPTFFVRMNQTRSEYRQPFEGFLLDCGTQMFLNL